MAGDDRPQTIASGDVAPEILEANRLLLERHPALEPFLTYVQEKNGFPEVTLECSSVNQEQCDAEGPFWTLSRSDNRREFFHIISIGLSQAGYSIAMQRRDRDSGTGKTVKGEDAKRILQLEVSKLIALYQAWFINDREREDPNNSGPVGKEVIARQRLEKGINFFNGLVNAVIEHGREILSTDICAIGIFPYPFGENTVGRSHLLGVPASAIASLGEAILHHRIVRSASKGGHTFPTTIYEDAIESQEMPLLDRPIIVPEGFGALFVSKRAKCLLGGKSELDLPRRNYNFGGVNGDVWIASFDLLTQKERDFFILARSKADTFLKTNEELLQCEDVKDLLMYATTFSHSCENSLDARYSIYLRRGLLNMIIKKAKPLDFWYRCVKRDGINVTFDQFEKDACALETSLHLQENSTTIE